jgi:hypothetical protein
MRKTVTYIADDGKEFDNERECYNYEWALKHLTIPEEVKFWDNDLTPLPQNCYYTMDLPYYIATSNIDAANSVDQQLERLGFGNLPFITNSYQVYYYDDYESKWLSYNEKLLAEQVKANTLGIKIEVNFNK